MEEKAGSAALADLIGKRVTIRLKDGDGFRDIVGTLNTQTSLTNRHGENIDFSNEEIAIWREIIPPIDRAGTGAPLLLRIMELENLSNKTWPAPTSITRGGWIYRKAHGITFRANSVFPSGPAPYGQPLENIADEISFCINFYKESGINPAILIPLPAYSELDRYLENLGWTSEIQARFLVKDLEGKTPEEISDYTFQVSRDPSPEWLAVQADEDIEEIMVAFPSMYLSLSHNKKIIATARVAVDGKWAILTRFFVSTDYRGIGLGKALMEKVEYVASNEGATKISLQVDETNEVALALYEKLGYRTHHQYVYRVLK